MPDAKRKQQSSMFAPGVAAKAADIAPERPDALPGIPEPDWRQITLAAVLHRHPEIAAKLWDRHGIGNLGSLARVFNGEETAILDLYITAAERDILRDELDRMRSVSDGFAAAVTRTMLGFHDEEGSVK